MKKYTLYSIFSVLLLIIVTAGSTYAYLSSNVNTQNNSILSRTTSLNIIYNGGETINNNMSVASSKEEGYNTTVSIRLAPNSAIARSDLYIYINEITPNIAIPGFIWPPVPPAAMIAFMLSPFCYLLRLNIAHASALVNRLLGRKVPSS